jgi:hypothetical protein
MDMTATTPNLEARIAAERKRLFEEQALQVELEKQRLIPLEAGNDDVLDEIEQKIARSIERAERIQERITLLERRLTESKATDKSARLDEIAGAAMRARDRAAGLLKKYCAPARTIATLLAEVRVCESQIAAANIELTAAGRDTIEPADPKRFAVTGYMGLIVDTVALHEVISLPHELDGQPDYWSPKDQNAHLAAQFSGGVFTPRSKAGEQ